MDNIYLRLAALEARENAERAENSSILQKAYENACVEHNAEEAAYFARKLRDKKLKESDEEMTLDRLRLDTSSALKFIASLKGVFESGWANYRQALRDLPEQEGFPFAVSFPQKPQADR